MNAIVILTVSVVVLAGVLSASATFWHTRNLSGSYDEALRIELEEKALAYSVTVTAFIDILGPEALSALEAIIESPPPASASGETPTSTQRAVQSLLGFEVWSPDSSAPGGYQLVFTQQVSDNAFPRNEEILLRLLDETSASQAPAAAIDEEANLILSSIVIPLDEETPLLGVATLSAEDEFAFFAAQRASATRNGILLAAAIIAFVSIIGGGGAIIIGRRISKPLAKLATGVEYVGTGDLTHVIDVDSSNEIGELAAAFNRMTANLARITASRDELDKEIAERKQTEKALRRSEAKYRTFFMDVQDIVFQTDTNGIIVEITPSVERFGYSRDALIGTSVLEIYEDPEQRAEVISAILEHGEISDFEIRLKTDDGSIVDMSISAHARYDANGVRRGMEGILRDITARKQAENALRERESQVQVLLENAAQGMVVIDSAGLIQLINARTEELFGYERAELIGQSIDMLLPERMRGGHAMARQDYFSHPHVRKMGSGLEIFGRRKDGTEFSAEISLSVTDWNGQPVGIASIMDITERKQEENALKRSLETERERARRDPLTGVLNHGAITEKLSEQCSSADGSPVAVAMVDLDGLKAINDTYGHLIGDQALIIVANALAEDDAIVGRYGGDEFIVILPGADRPEAERFRDAVTAKLLDARLPDPETNAKIQIVASWGLAIFPEEAETIVDLIHLSDSAMYAAKRERPVQPGQLDRREPLGSDRAAELVGALVPLLTSPGNLDDKLRLVSHRLSVGAGYDAVDFSMFAPEPGAPLAQNTFAHGDDDLIHAWQREQRKDSPEPHPIRLLFERAPRPVILNDPWNDELLLPRQREILQAAGLKSVLVAPLVWQDHVLGSLGVAKRQENAFTPADAQFLMAVAAQVTAIMRMESVVADLRASTARLSQAQEETVLLLAAAAEAHDHTTGLHLQSVRSLTEALAHELGYAEADATALGLASALHDIGKIRVTDAILASPAKLKTSQWEIMKKHTTWGADFLSGHEGFELAAAVALRHHERWDGSGYPEGIAGDAIPETATIVAVADAFDAITHNRPYRAGRSVDEAVAEIVAHGGKQFNPKVVTALERLHQRNRLPTVYPEVSDTETAA